MSLTFENFPTAYKAICNAAVSTGELVSPRGLQTHEMRNYAFTIADSRQLLPVGVNRKLARKLAYEEALQLCGGFTSTSRLADVSPHIMQFADHGVFHGAYGPRVVTQIEAAVAALKADPSTRRSIINIWDPMRDNFTQGMANYPCTTQLQFMVRNDKVEIFVIMRANDVWAGLAYDVFCFGQLQHTVANTLELEAGPYHHYASSMHAYSRDIDKIEALADYNGQYGSLDPTGFGRPGEAIKDTMARIQAYALGKDALRTESEKLYNVVLAR